MSRGQAFMVERAVRGVSAEGPRGQSDSRFCESSAICFLPVGQEEGTIWEACPPKPQLVMGSSGRVSHRRQPLTSAEIPVPAQDLGWWVLDAASLVRGGVGTEPSICGTEAGALCWGQADSGHRTKKSCGYSPPENAPTGVLHV